MGLVRVEISEDSKRNYDVSQKCFKEMRGSYCNKVTWLLC